MESHVHLLKAQQLALDKFTALTGINQIDQIVAQGSEVRKTRLEAYMRYKTTLIRHFSDHVASAMPTHYISVSEEDPTARPFILSVMTFERKEGVEISFLDPRSENGHGCLHAQLGATTSWLGHFELCVKAKDKALTYNTSVYASFPTFNS